MTQLSHENVVQLLYFFFSNGSKKDEVYLNLVLEFIPETLYSLARSFSKQKLAMPSFHISLCGPRCFVRILFSHLANRRVWSTGTRTRCIAALRTFTRSACATATSSRRTSSSTRRAASSSSATLVRACVRACIVGHGAHRGRAGGWRGQARPSGSCRARPTSRTSVRGRSGPLPSFFSFSSSKAPPMLIARRVGLQVLPRARADLWRNQLHVFNRRVERGLRRGRADAGPAHLPRRKRRRPAWCAWSCLLAGWRARGLLTDRTARPGVVEIIKVMGTPTKEQIATMNPSYTDFKSVSPRGRGLARVPHADRRSLQVPANQRQRVVQGVPRRHAARGAGLYRRHAHLRAHASHQQLRGRGLRRAAGFLGTTRLN